MTTFTNRRNLLWLLIGLITIERLCSHLFNLNLLPGLTADAGMLLLWGIGHCDTMDGPVVSLGKKALTEKNVNFVLPWVRAEDEAEIRRAFEHAQAVRELGPQAMALADEHFLETLVRVHRAGEGAPYTGLKPAGLDIGPAVPAADLAIKTGSVDTLCTLLTEAVRTRLHTLFDDANTKKHYDVNDVGAGRAYVEAYVTYVHFAEKIWQITSHRKSESQCGGHKAAARLGHHTEHHHS